MEKVESCQAKIKLQFDIKDYISKANEYGC